ncbi:MAG TPA: hypothetical protein VFX98_16700, partial [Longimicrobiaceae bacterium]|nr:hypothetical protein [Longimicrobiaceae bacterium]
RQGPVAVAFAGAAAALLGTVFALGGDLAALLLAHAAYNAAAVAKDRWRPFAARRVASAPAAG